jgi:putative isomerase
MNPPTPDPVQPVRNICHIPEAREGAGPKAALRSPLPELPASSRWHTGNLLAFSHLDGPTDYENGLVARTVTNGLDIKWPGDCGIRFRDDIRSARVASDWFDARGRSGAPIRGVLLDAHHLLINGDCEILSITAAVATTSSEGRLLLGSASHFNPALLAADFDEALKARRHWLADTGVCLPDSPLSPAARNALARAASQMKGQVSSPEGLIHHAWTTPDRWPHRAMWLWDTAFHAIGWRHLDPALARSMISAVLDTQRGDGLIPLMTSPRERAVMTQPPVLALAAQLVLEKSDDAGWLAEIYPGLCAYVRWSATHRDIDGGGMVEWFIDKNPECRSGESGMDNSPRFDGAIPLDAPDFNAFLAGEYEVLSGFARRLGKAGEAAHWSTLHGRLCRLMNEKLWSAEHSLYCDRDPVSGTLTPVLSSAGFLPLLCGAPDEKRARAMAAHLENPATFGTHLPIPSIAACRGEYYSKDMWRGPVWININWLVARGLERYGLHEAAERLRHLTLRELEWSCALHGTFFEYYDDRGQVEPSRLLRKGKNIPGEHPHQAIHDYGWSATLYVDWLLSNRAAGSPRSGMDGPLDPSQGRVGQTDTKLPLRGKSGASPDGAA